MQTFQTPSFCCKSRVWKEMGKMRHIIINEKWVFWLTSIGLHRCLSCWPICVVREPIGPVYFSPRCFRRGHGKTAWYPRIPSIASRACLMGTRCTVIELKSITVYGTVPIGWNKDPLLTYILVSLSVPSILTIKVTHVTTLLIIIIHTHIATLFAICPRRHHHQVSHAGWYQCFSQYTPKV